MNGRRTATEMLESLRRPGETLEDVAARERRWNLNAQPDVWRRLVIWLDEQGLC